MKIAVLIRILVVMKQPSNVILSILPQQGLGGGMLYKEQCLQLHEQCIFSYTMALHTCMPLAILEARIFFALT